MTLASCQEKENRCVLLHITDSYNDKKSVLI